MNIPFKKMCLILWISLLEKYDFEKNGGQITGYSISEINKNLLNTNIYI